MNTRKMKVWLVKLEEPVHLSKDSRPYRMSMLAQALLNDGHDVVRWCSDFDHLALKSRYGRFTSYSMSENYEINFVPASVEYKKPVSIRRVVNNYQVLRNFLKLAANSDKPDVIVCSMPTPSMAKACAVLASRYSVPLVLDARDMWPDVIKNELRGWKSIVAIPLLFKMKRDLQFAAKHATSCVGITKFYRDFLLSYADRPASDLDTYFPLGYQSVEVENEWESLEYWRRHGIDLPSQEKIVYFAGRLNSTVLNGLEPVIRASNLAEELSLPLKFVVCGSGQFQEKIKNRVQGLKNFVLPGEVDPKYLPTLRKYSFVAIQPIENREDYLNSLSNKFFEYISSGLPILTYLEGITRSTVEEYQCGYHYKDSDQLIKQFRILLNDPDLHQQLSRNSRILFASQFEYSKVYGAFSKHISKVVESANKDFRHG